jgi:molybdopterin-guanine dinucleotide biosynthesis protein A
MALHPGAAWLVVACDLPFISGETIEALIQQRNPFKVATAYQSAHDGLPEPLCAIYEPKGYARLLQFLGRGCTCPRKILIHSEIQMLQQSNRGSLDNVNNPQEYKKAVALISKGGGGVSKVMAEEAVKRINVRYYALFREERGLNEETLETGASTARELYGHLKEKYHFSLPWESLRVAINDEFAGWEEPLNGGDELVFIPPVSGG